MLKTKILLENKTKEERQSHLDLNEQCVERGGISTNHKGVLAQFLGTDIPFKRPLLCHACHNGKCSNPRHLYWGSDSENRQDALDSGRIKSRKGCKGHPQSEETRKKISATTSGRPSNNPTGRDKEGNLVGAAGPNGVRGLKYKRKYKQQWITDGIQNTRIPLECSIPEGFRKGRYIRG